MQKEYTPIGWQFWLQWMGATSVSWIAGAVLSHTLDLGLPGGLGEVVGETAWGLLRGREISRENHPGVASVSHWTRRKKA